MRIVAIADTHYRHRQVVVPDGDVLVHAGDLTRSGDPEELREVIHWLSDLPHRKVLISGNHDWVFELQPAVAAEIIPPDFHYLEDSGCEISGVKFWGSPVQPAFLGWAFNRPRGREIDLHWQKIPLDTQVLVTHGPPYKKLDRVGNEHVGCEFLRRRVETVRPLCHIFGHIHSSYGTDALGPTQLVNCAICTEDYRPVNGPIVIDIENGVAVVQPRRP